MKRPLEVYEMPHCACCGQLFTWKKTVKSHGDRKLRFCSTSCSSIFDEYLLKTYGDDIINTLDSSVFEPA